MPLDQEKSKPTGGKRNNGRLLPRIGYRIEFDSDAKSELIALRFRLTDLTAVPGLADKLPLAQRIVAELGREGRLLPSVIAENLGVDPKAVSARLSELEGRGKIVRFPDRSAALKAHQAG